MEKPERASARISRRGFVTGMAGIAAIASLFPNGDVAASASPEWKLLGVGDGPAARWDHTIAADDEAKQLIVFGGRDTNYAALGDTWLYDLSKRVWRSIDGPAPAARFGHAVAVDQSARKLVLFGGQAADFFNDTWVFDFESETWSQLDTGSGGPSPRYGLPAVFDGEGRFIVSHGFTFEGRFNDTWSLDLSSNTWIEISPEGDGVRPLNRCLHEMAWDESAGRIVLFGGCSSGFGPCPQGDLWSFDPSARTWTEITPADGPAARSNPALAFDRKGGRVLLAGGLTEAGYTADVWEGRFDGDPFLWSELNMSGEAPSPRASHDLVLTRGDIYLFGGTGDPGVSAELWKLSLG